MSTPELSPEMRAAAELCRIYFEIAAEVIGEDEVRRRRDERLGVGVLSQERNTRD